MWYGGCKIIIQEVFVMRTMFKKAVALLMATAVVVSGAAAVNGTTASAAKKKAKSKTYKVQAWYAGVQGKNACYWIAGDGSSKGKVYMKNVKVTKGKKSKVTITIKNPTKKKITAGTVFTVDVIDILKDYKKNKVKISGVTVKVDGKKKGCKAWTGCFEPKTKPNNYRVSVCNKWGTDGDNSPRGSKKFAFKKTISISFTIMAK